MTIISIMPDAFLEKYLELRFRKDGKVTDNFM